MLNALSGETNLSSHAVTSSPQIPKTNANWNLKDPPLITLLAVDTVVTIVAACILGSCVLWIWKARTKKKEERDKLGTIVRTYYWEEEEKFSLVLRVLAQMKQNSIFREVTELHLLGYVLRSEDGIYGQQDRVPDIEQRLRQPFGSSLNVKTTVKKIERFFETLALHLSCKGRCSKNVAAVVASTVLTLSHSTALLWSNEKAHLISTIVHYFVGRHAEEHFTNNVVSDEDLECLVLARVPYVTQLYLNEDHFVLQDIDITTDMKIDIRNKIRFIDTVLAKNEKKLQSKEKNLIESYYAARELCLKAGYIHSKTHLPDIVTKVGETSKVSECVIYLRHLLRILCIPKHMRKCENDDKFFQFLMQLHETLYTWSDTNAMLEVIERSRTNIVCYVRGLTVEQILLDKEFTKAKLEQVEKELYRHLSYLTLKQVHEDRARRPILSRGDTDPRSMRSMDSETSIYTMAMSTSSFMMRRQATQEQPRDIGKSLDQLHRQTSLDLPTSSLPHQTSLDQASLLSSSSLYATAASLSSNENAGGFPSPRPGPSHEPASPKSTDSDYFETAV